MTAVVFSDAPSVVPVVPENIAAAAGELKDLLNAVVFYGILITGFGIPLVAAVVEKFFIS